jgi:GalNAc-alpha-(1->4)-GalNAc-alpha-(1->3)-diNAcBac-PP-undecaprenol alpha-1,4-N-acetyl-D-galactosaminyltransferase
MAKKRIAFVIPSLHSGGMERVFSELANYFSTKQDLEIHLIMYGKRPKLFYNLSARVIVYQPKASFNNRFRTFSTLMRLIYLRRQIQRIRPVTILSFGEYWNNLVLLSLLGLHYPVFVSDRCRPDKRLGRMQDILRGMLYPKASGVIVQTQKAKEIYSRIVSEVMISVVGNPFRVFEEALSSRKKSILMVSRFIATKHHDRLISIFSKLNAPDWNLVFVGEEAQKQKHIVHLKQLAKDLNVSNRVLFEGEQKNVARYYLSSSIFAFTSSSEGFPNVVGEALSAGLPVVSYNCVAGPSEMITDGENGFLVPVFADECFQQRLQLLIDDESMRVKMGQKAKESMKKFSMESIGPKYIDIILS